MVAHTLTKPRRFKYLTMKYLLTNYISNPVMFSCNYHTSKLNNNDHKHIVTGLEISQTKICGEECDSCKF